MAVTQLGRKIQSVSTFTALLANGADKRVMVLSLKVKFVFDDRHTTPGAEFGGRYLMLTIEHALQDL